MIPSEHEMATLINAHCEGPKGDPHLDCIWCQIYHAVTALRTIRTTLGMDGTDATAPEMAEAVEALYNDYTKACNAKESAQGTLEALRDILDEELGE